MRDSNVAQSSLLLSLSLYGERQKRPDTQVHERVVVRFRPLCNCVNRIATPKMFQLFHRQQSKSNDKSFVIVDRDGRIKMEIDTAELFGEKCRANAGDNEDEVKQNAENEEKEFALNFDDEEDEADHKFCYGLQYSSQGQLELSGIDADTESIDQQCLEDKPNSSISAKGFSKFERRWFSVNDMASGAYQKKLLELVMSSSSGDWNMVGQKECWLTPFYRFFGRLSNAKTTETTLDIPLEKLVEPRKIGCGGQGDVYVGKHFVLVIFDFIIVILCLVLSCSKVSW